MEKKPERSKSHVVYFEPHGGRGPCIMCTCGWMFIHVRAKVMQKAMIRHNEKTGHEIKLDKPSQ